jgi:A/G-specific adenine glycosylase
MDLGATVCLRSGPACPQCPVRATCIALREGRIAELPGRKVARPASNRAVTMFVVVSHDEVLVEKRPPAGIWGGLWSLPEAPAGTEPAAWVARNCGVRVEAVEPLEPFAHAFTHFTLGVTPWLVRVKGSAPVARKTASMWLPLHEASAAALPAPVKKLLANLTRVVAGRGAPAREGTGAGSRAARRRR